ncbi:MAG: RNA polymerase sigma factor (sigma-70 family) [Candidatus Azotimanducaceae bacterium]|jgi:RNA polymerase sigma factor (sigma-70 family)
MPSVDAELVRKVIEGTGVESRSAYGDLVKLHESAVRGLLRTLCRNLAQADDLAQDAFLQGWQRLSSLQHPEKFGGWIKRLAYRLFLHAERRKKVEQRYFSDVVAEGEQTPLNSEGFEISEVLSELLAMVDQSEGELLILAYGFGFTMDEIAQDRGVPLGTIKSILSRAKSRIREQQKVKTGAMSHAGV